MTKILIVDDDPHINELVEIYFSADGFKTFSCLDGETALEKFDQVKPDLVILDLMLPGKSGFDVLRILRKTSDVPVIMLTARGDTLDQVVGLELGADDYVTKPFEPKELIARVKAVLRRTRGDLGSIDKRQPIDDNVVEYPGFILDKNNYSLQLEGRSYSLPPKEMELLFFLAKNPNHVFTREQLLENIWGFDYLGESRTVDVHVKRLREKLDKTEHPGWNLVTVWSVGYKFETS
ncbi:MAG: response regulator transcription factor [Clostridiaceae bacterium]|jgi:DNA-binding response OmpR family regulator|nr:response regulator transcription factor [Bacillota bacterium]NLN52318.1 response regulator transcription factor [Clostridiaceae bacterium]